MNLRTLITRASYFALGLYNGFFFLPVLRTGYWGLFKGYRIFLNPPSIDLFMILYTMFPIFAVLSVILSFREIRRARYRNIDFIVVGLSLGILAFLAFLFYAIFQIMEAMYWSGDF